MASRAPRRTQSGFTRFPELDRVLAALADGAEIVLGGNFVGAYLEGSFALGDGDAYSDADFIVVTRQDPTADEVSALNAMHGALHDRPEVWAQHLEGSYIRASILRTAPVPPGPLWFLNNGDRVLVRSEHDNTNVVRWVLREHGITLRGPDPRQLIDPVAPASLRAEVRSTMRVFGQELLQGTAALDVLWRQGFTVLFYCRALQSLATATIPSKPSALRWARIHLDPRWWGLVERAWEQRARYPRGRGAPDAHRALRPEADEAAATLAFVRHALALVGESPA